MAHNDHLQQPRIERTAGAARGVYYKGIAMTSAEFIIIAPDMETLRKAWAEFSQVPLNEEKCVEVGLFAAKDIRPVMVATPAASGENK